MPYLGTQTRYHRPVRKVFWGYSFLPLGRLDVSTLTGPARLFARLCFLGMVTMMPPRRSCHGLPRLWRGYGLAIADASGRLARVSVWCVVVPSARV